MKYFSVLVFAVLLAWTWNMIHHEQPISFETHAGIQEKFAQLIQQSVLHKKPDATHIHIDKVWTEPESATRILTHFLYSFQEADTSGKSVTSQIQGEGVLEKQPDDSSGLERWSLTQVKTTGDSVTFEDGLIVTPGEDPAPPESPVTTSPSTPSDTSHQ